MAYNVGMDVEERVMQALQNSVEEVNQQVAEENRIDFDLSTPLIGDDSPLDSLGLVSLIVSAEGNINQDFDVSLALIDAEAMNDQQGVFRNLAALRDHIIRLLQDQAGT
ncbi:MAG TPA: hypothetical protein VLU25_07875 [Acidobacteriota bacterium]|nr:hypothetical protein [Acidobacteriota bacterium]